MMKQEANESRNQMYLENIMNHCLDVNEINDFVNGWDLRDMTISTVRGMEVPSEVVRECLSYLELPTYKLAGISKKIDQIRKYKLSINHPNEYKKIYG